MHPAPRVFVPAESVLRCLQLHHLLEDKKVHSSELMWIHLCHLRSLPSPALVFTELTCVYLYSCPPVFTVPYLPHVCPETPPQAGLHTESLLGTSRGKKEAIWCCPLPPGLNGITQTQNPHSTVSDLRTSGALTWLGAHWSAFLSSSLCNPSSQVHEHPHSCRSNLCSTLLLLHTRWPSESPQGNQFYRCSSTPLSRPVLLRWSQHHLPPSHCAAQPGILSSGCSSFLLHSMTSRMTEIHLLTPRILGSSLSAA